MEHGMQARGRRARFALVAVALCSGCQDFGPYCDEPLRCTVDASVDASIRRSPLRGDASSPIDSIPSFGGDASMQSVGPEAIGAFSPDGGKVRSVDASSTATPSQTPELDAASPLDARDAAMDVPSVNGAPGSSEPTAPQANSDEGDANTPEIASESDASGGRASDAGKSESGESPCTAFVNDGACPPNSRCMHKRFEAGSECVVEGSGVSMDACTSDTDCRAGYHCAGLCQPVCDPHAVSGAPGSCSEGKLCYDETDPERPTNIGSCLDTCEYGVRGCGPSQYCQIAELWWTEADMCTHGPESLEFGFVGETCPGPEAGGYCGGKHMCLDTTDLGLRCFELCRYAVAPFGSEDVPNHPDCLDPSATTCSPVFGANSGLGACISAD
jgi:hypothetical protein